HDRSRFETYAISFGPDDHSAMRKRLEAGFDHFLDARRLSDEATAQLIRAREIDIAVDLKGFTFGSRPGIFALRPAPVQVNYLGHPGTLGSPCIDYLVADRWLIPEELRAHYAEQIVYLPGCYQANTSWQPTEAAATRPAYGLPEEAFVFCCFNQLYKITPDVF